MFSWLGKQGGGRERTGGTDVVQTVTGGLRDLYLRKLLPLEEHYRFHDFHSPALEEADFENKPMVLLVGQYSTGKTTFIRYATPAVRGSFPEAAARGPARGVCPRPVRLAPPQCSLHSCPGRSCCAINTFCVPAASRPGKRNTAAGLPARRGSGAAAGVRSESPLCRVEDGCCSPLYCMSASCLKIGSRFHVLLRSVTSLSTSS